MTSCSLFSKGKIFEKVDNDYETVLPYFFPPPLSYSLHGAITSSIILSKQETHEWFLNNFVNVSFSGDYSESDGDHVFQIYPLQYTRSGKNAASIVLQDIVLDSDLIDINSETLVSNMISWVKQGYYVSAVVNVKKLPGTKYYKKDSTSVLLHGITCFGFNLANRTFKLMDFDNRENLSLIDVDFNILKEAFFFDKRADYKYRVSLRRHKDRFLYKFDLRIFKNQLKDYIYASDSGLKDSVMLEYEKDLIWGIKTYDYVIRYMLLCFERYRRIDIRMFCAMTEHKMLMLDRLNFVKNNILVSRKIPIQKYRQIAEMVDGVKMYVLKNEKNIIENGDTEWLTRRLKKIKKKENKILRKLYRIFRRWRE